MPNKHQPCPNCGNMAQPAIQANLSAPQQPSDIIVKIIKVWRWIFGGAFGLILVMLTIFFSLMIFLPSVLFNDMGLSILGGIGFIPVLCAMIPTGVLMVVIPWLAAKYVNQYHQKQYTQWQKATEKYTRLWYCPRCAGIWLENQNRVVPVEHMQAFLYEIQSPQSAWPLP